jgi:N utilization substance protein A
MQIINLASKIIKTDIIDCMNTEEMMIFVIRKGFLGIAIGPKAKNLDKLRNSFKKNIKFVEYDGDQEKFIINLFKPYKINNIIFDGTGDNTIAKVEVERRDKSKIIGKEGRNIEIIRNLAKRHHSLKDVQIS